MRILLPLLAVPLLLTPGCGLLDDDRSPTVPAAREVRATWVVCTDLASQDAVERVVEEGLEAGLNTLVVQVRSRGDAWYLGGLEPRAPVLKGSEFDPLGATLEAAHGEGLAVHAWVNANLILNVSRPATDARHVAWSHPEWLLVPLALADQLLALPPGHPEYREALMDHARANRRRVEGLYGDPSHPGYREHVVTVCRDIARRYPVDGIHLDYIRHPGKDWGYGRAALDAFRVEVDRELDGEERQEMARRVARDPLTYTRRYPVRWGAFRRRAVDRLVEEVARAVRAVRPGATLSAAVAAGIAEARDQRHQDWTQWLERGWIDVACPMNYADARARELFDTRARATLAARGRGRIWMGIGAWKLPIEETLDRIRAVRELGAQGILLFSHRGLRDQQGSFATLQREVFGPPEASP